MSEVKLVKKSQERMLEETMFKVSMLLVLVEKLTERVEKLDGKR